MMAITLTATDNASTTQPQTPTKPIADTRRISEHDADYQRLHTRTLRKLRASLRQLVRDLEATPWHLRSERERVANLFIHRHTALIATAYEEAHREGQRDYYAPQSNTPSRWLRDVPHARLARTLRFYALGSVNRLAVEALAATQPRAHVLSDGIAPSPQIVTTASYSGYLAVTLDDASDWLASVDVRLVGQSQATWAGLQDGYYDGGLYDTANPFYYVFWQLEPAAKHCADCPAMADGSPYTPPGSGTGHELDATPGDGTTECGAGCKCSLRYGGGDEVKAATAWRDYRETLQRMKDAGLLDLERDLRRTDTMSLDPTAGFTSMFEQPEQIAANTGALGGALDYDAAYQQRAAQDAYRSVWDQWDVARGDLPQLPRLAWMFAHPDQLDGLTFEQFIESLPEYANQTPVQQRILQRWVEAILRLGGGGGEED